MKITAIIYVNAKIKF